MQQVPGDHLSCCAVLLRVALCHINMMHVLPFTATPANAVTNVTRTHDSAWQIPTKVEFLL